MMKNATYSAAMAAKKRLGGIECRPDEPMKKHTSFCIGGPVRAMFFPAKHEEFIVLHELLREHGVRPLIMGNGTNLLVDDGPLDLLVINLTKLNHLERTGDLEITADAGVSLARIAVAACEAGLSGFEFAHGIPGTLGGAVAMNAGAYGGEMKDVIRSTAAYNPETGGFTVNGGEHSFSYRRSRFTDTDDVVLRSAITLRNGDRGRIRAEMDEFSALRRESQPLETPSAGSTFKRPKEGYAAALIEQAGLKGFTVGGAQVSEKHSGFIINKGGASFSDVVSVIGHVRETVFNQTGVELEPEVKIIKSTELL